MTKKTMMSTLSAILFAGCAQFAEMDETRVAGNTYLTGRFYEQVGELETLAAKSPELGYSTARIVQEILPPKGSGAAWVARTKYSKIEYPMTKEEFNKWMNTIDGNIAKLRDKINAEAEEAKRKEAERVAEAKRQEEERIARQKAAAEEANRKEEERVAEAKQQEAKRKESEHTAETGRREAKARYLWGGVKADLEWYINNYNFICFNKLDFAQLRAVASNEYVSVETKQNASKYVEDFVQWQSNVTNIYLDSKYLASKIGPIFVVKELEGKLTINFNEDNLIIGQFVKLQEIPEYHVIGIGMEKVEQANRALYKDCAELCHESKKVINISQAAKVSAEMSDAEKFPLLSVLPKPQMLMKDCPSGASMKWVEAWLTANKIEHGLAIDFANRQGYAVSESDLIESIGDIKNMTLVKGFFGKRSVIFGFLDNVLINITITFDYDYDVRLDAVVEKYSRELGPGADINVIPLKTKGRQSELVARITTNDIGVFAWEDLFYWDSSVILNESGKDFVSRALPDSNLKASEQRVKFIKIYDRKLLAYIEKRKAENAKAAEEAKKAEAAAALDF